MPVHLPAVSGPARVWVIAQTLEEKKPSDTQEAMSNPIDNDEFSTNAAGNISPEHNNSPPTANVFRTNVAVWPWAINRSDVHPPVSDATAMPQNGNEPNTAICSME